VQPESTPFSLRPAFASLLFAIACLAGCGGNGSSSSTLTIPDAPKDLGFVDTAPAATVSAPFIDNVATNQRGDARYATIDTNAGVRVVGKFLDLWTPRSLFVDAGVTAAANGSFPAVVASDWTGIPGDATDGKATALGQTVLAANISYVETATNARTSAQELAAYLDDRRGKGYSVTDGMGPLTSAWLSGSQQTTTITNIASDATTKLYNDGGNNTGVGSASGNTAFGSVVDLVNTMGNNGSTEPAKRYFKYARPWRWSGNVSVVPALVPAKSSTPATDGGFVSGHAAEATRDAVGMAYAVPERFQEILSRGLELGENRILAGMHSPLDVIGGRIQGQAVAIANLYDSANTATKAKAYADAHTYLQAQVGVSSAQALNDYAHSAATTTDRFADYASNKANYLRRMTYGFSPIGATNVAAVVPKGAEVVLETRLPYLSADQRRVVLKTTALSSGYPVADDAEGWGRLNLFAAADGYGAFNGDVVVTQDASAGGFSAVDSWRNDISGTGKLTKLGTGTLNLQGSNTWSGGTVVAAGTLVGKSTTAFGKGDVYVSQGTLQSNASAAINITKYTQLDAGTLKLVIGSGAAGQLSVSGLATIAGGTLQVSFQNGYTPKVGDTITVLTASSLLGTFKTITVNGFTVTPHYTSTSLTLHIDA